MLANLISSGKIVYVDSPGSYIGKKQKRIYIKKESGEIIFFNYHNLDSIVVFQKVSFSSDALVFCREHGISVIFLDSKGCVQDSYYGINHRNYLARKCQVLCSISESLSIQLAKLIIKEKIFEMGRLVDLDSSLSSLEGKSNFESVLGVEGYASKKYFDWLRGKFSEIGFNFTKREFYPCPDPVNCLLSMGYALLYAEIEKYVAMFGLDPYVGFLHRDTYNRKSLICDLIEPFRSSIADQYILLFVKENNVRIEDFIFKNPRNCYFNNHEKRNNFYRFFRNEFLTDDHRKDFLKFTNKVYEEVILQGSQLDFKITEGAA